MAGISATLVAKLRKISGQGMMDCKKALEESDGDIDRAMDILRKKGLATLAKRADRDTSEGKVICCKNADGKTAAMATLCCETDFVAKSDDFVRACQLLADCCLAASGDEWPENIMQTEINGRKFADILTETVSKTGEKTQVGDFIRFRIAGNGIIGTYVHFNDKVGSMVEIETDSDSAAGALKSAAADIAMHITAINPVSVDRDSVDREIVEKERAVAAEQVKNKPANIVDKIVQGKIDKFFRDNCLIEQPFVKDDSRTVGQFLSEAAKAAGGTAKIKRFIRLEIG